jgi:tRNA-dihydrouridine synthase B
MRVACRLMLASRLQFAYITLRLVPVVTRQITAPPPQAFAGLFRRGQPVLALAPMQDITDLPFLRLMARYGGADLYFTEYFRVYSDSKINRHILRSITENPTGRPIVAQLIGNDIPELVRTARELQEFPVAGIDLNLGCPAPVVYRKCAGGGLLREPAKVDAIVGALRAAVEIPFTVKTRVGFDAPEVFARILEVLGRHALDLVTVHGRTVKDMYRSEVRYDLISQAVTELPCPVLANGNVHSARKALEVLEKTRARGLMIGRGAIRNPWIFEQIRQVQRAESPVFPIGRQVLSYVRELYEVLRPEARNERAQVTRLKKHMNYLGLGVDPAGVFLHDIRRVTTEADFFRVCTTHLEHDHPMPLDPFDLELKSGDVMAGIHD